MQDIIREFKNPPALYRPAPLWVWNDEMTEEAIAFQLKELAEHGFGGAFVHPRPGLVTEYLSDRWFSPWGYALDCAKKLGIKLYIYDENSYPSGFAGGHVSGIVPEGIAAYARIRIAETPEGVRQSGDCVGVYAATDSGNGLEGAVDLAGIPESEWKNYGNRFIAVHTEKQGTTGWMAGFAYVDLMRPEVHDAFMETTSSISSGSARISGTPFPPFSRTSPPWGRSDGTLCRSPSGSPMNSGRRTGTTSKRTSP